MKVPRPHRRPGSVTRRSPSQPLDAPHPVIQGPAQRTGFSERYICLPDRDSVVDTALWVAAATARRTPFPSPAPSVALGSQNSHSRRLWRLHWSCCHHRQARVLGHIYSRALHLAGHAGFSWLPVLAHMPLIYATQADTRKHTVQPGRSAQKQESDQCSSPSHHQETTTWKSL